MSTCHVATEECRARDSCVFNATLLELEGLVQQLPFASEIDMQGVEKLPPEYLEKLLFMVKGALLNLSQRECAKAEFAEASRQSDERLAQLELQLDDIKTKDKLLEERSVIEKKEQALEIKKEAAMRHQKSMQSVECIRQAEKLESEKKREAYEEQRLKPTSASRG